MRADCLVRTIVGLSESAIVKKEVIATGEFHVAAVEGEYAVSEPELLIVVLVSPKWVGVFLNCLFLTALVLATLFLVSF